MKATMTQAKEPELVKKYVVPNKVSCYQLLLQKLRQDIKKEEELIKQRPTCQSFEQIQELARILLERAKLKEARLLEEITKTQQPLGASA